MSPFSAKSFLAGAASGPGVVLFPSLAGSVLEVKKTQTRGWKEGDRVWMALGALAAGTGGDQEVVDSATSSHKVKNAFVQHMALNPHSNGDDLPGFAVRAKEGLAGCEYLSEDLLAKGDTAIMGVITAHLKPFGYAEFDPVLKTGSMIGASYDWRLMPAMMEERDGFFTRIMEQTESMVNADPGKRPAVLIGFSLGCRIAKYRY